MVIENMSKFQGQFEGEIKFLLIWILFSEFEILLIVGFHILFMKHVYIACVPLFISCSPFNM